MPDWTYQTVFRPLLFRLGADGGRDLALGGMGRLARFPLGTRVIQFMGHMRPDPRLEFRRGDLRLQSRVGLGGLFDSRLAATEGLGEFGFGYIEIGPIVGRTLNTGGRINVHDVDEAMRFQAVRRVMSCEEAGRRLQGIKRPFKVPLFARIEPDSASECVELVSALSSQVQGFVISAERVGHLPETAVSNLLIAINSRSWSEEEFRRVILPSVISGRVMGIVVEGGCPETGESSLGSSELAGGLELLRRVRAIVGAEVLVIGAAGIHCPADALDALEAGADLVQVDSGLVYAGPGLPKRINEAVLYLHERTHPREEMPARASTQSWFWGFLMGLSMFVGGLLALLIASTRVLLPYDEAMSGFNRETLGAINSRLLSFMTHDRVTLAGTMLAVGILYLTLSGCGIRRGVHWAWVTVIASGFCGFFTFFLFLGFGYFDPFHAFVTAILFQFLLLTVHSPLPLRHDLEMPELWNDGGWKRHQWGQLMFVIHGAVLIVAGAVISCVGMTTIFVREDLEFMNTTFEALCGPNPALLPLIAHDRATFGGMLISCGVATFLSALWGFGCGRAWLWRGLVLAGTVAYGTAILVHWIVVYNSLVHLLPAYGGVVWLWVSAGLSYRFMMGGDSRLVGAWKEYVGRWSARE